MKFIVFTLAIILNFTISYSQSKIGVNQKSVNDSLYLTVKQMRQDFHFFTGFIEHTHPNIEHTADFKKYNQLKNEIFNSFQNPLTNREFWFRIAKLNTVYKDGHVGIKFPETLINLSPDIRIENGSTYISLSNNEKWQLIAINNQKLSPIIKNLRDYVRGETIEIQEFIIEKHFDEALSVYEIELTPNSKFTLLNKDGKTRILRLSEILKKQKKAKKQRFRLDISDSEVAILQIDTFLRDFEEEFDLFLKESFKKIKAKKYDKLIIDISQNGGGAKELSNLLLSYLTNDKYSSTSKITARITKDNINRLPGAKLGDVLTLPFEQWVSPKSDYTFEGQVYVFIGKRTYSQSIVFCNVIKDFEIGLLIGQSSSGKVNQTGQVKTVKLPNSRYTAIAPIYIFYKYKEAHKNNIVTPHLELSYHHSDDFQKFLQFIKRE